MGGKRGKKGKKKSGLSAGQKAARKKLASLGRAPKSFGGPTKAQTMAKNRIAAKKATASKAASMGATNKSFTSGLPSYSSLTSKTEAKKTFSPKAKSGPSFSKSLAMATTPAPKPKVTESTDVASDYMPGGEPTLKEQRDAARSILNSGMKLNEDQTKKLMQQATMKLDLAQAGVGAPHSNVRIDTHVDGFGNTFKRVLPEFGAGRVGDVRLKNKLVDAGFNSGVLTAFNPASGMSIGALGTPANAATVDSKYSPTIGGLDKMLGFNPATGTFNESRGSTGLVGVTGGGLNIGGAGFNQSDGGGAASRAINVGKAYGPGVDGNQYAKDVLQARFPGASPNSAIFGMDAAQLNQPGGPFAQPGPTPENTPEADYTSYQPGSPYNLSNVDMNATNMMRSGRNLITAPFRALGIDTGLTNRLYPKSNEAIQGGIDNRSQFNVANNRRPVARRRGGGGGARLPVEQPLTPEEILQPQQLAAAQSGPVYQQAGMDNSRLMQIQNDAYSRQMSQIYNPMEIGGFNPMFRFFGRRGGAGRGAFRKAFRRN